MQLAVVLALPYLFYAKLTYTLKGKLTAVYSQLTCGSAHVQSTVTDNCVLKESPHSRKL